MSVWTCGERFLLSFYKHILNSKLSWSLLHAFLWLFPNVAVEDFSQDVENEDQQCHGAEESRSSNGGDALQHWVHPHTGHMVHPAGPAGRHCIRCTGCHIYISFYPSVRNTKTVQSLRLDHALTARPVEGMEGGRNSLPADVRHAEDTHCHQTPQPSGILVVSGPHLDDHKWENSGMLGGRGNMERDFWEHTVERVSPVKDKYI